MARKARIIKADYLLKDKIGTGEIDKGAIKKCQNILDSNTFDYTPMAQIVLDKLFTTIEKTKNSHLTRNQATQEMTESIMQLKANAPIFHYDLLGELANIMLNFLENITEIDDHAIEIVSAHHKTLSVIISKKMTGDGGDIGTAFKKELQSACERYHSKNKSPLQRS